MTNEVATARSTSLGSLDALKQNLQSVRSRLPEGGGVQYARMLKDGDWVFGQDDNIIEPGTRAVVNPMSIKQGFSCWTNRQPGEGKNELMGEVMVNLGQNPPTAHELEKHEDPKTGASLQWREQIALDMKLADGKNKGAQIQWKTGSVGGKNAARTVIDAIVSRLDEDTEFVCPIITVDSGSYKHKAYGKIYTPEFKVVGWADINGNLENYGDEPDEEPEVEADEAPRRRRRA